MKQGMRNFVQNLLFVGFVTFLVAPSSLAFNRSVEPVSRGGHSSPPRRTQVLSNKNVQADSIAAEDLIADGVMGMYKLKVEAALSERSNRQESIDAPAIDVYGANSWGSFVDPYAGLGKANVPNEYEIDCSGFVMPLKKGYRVNSNYGYRRRYRRQHYGVDLSLRTGDTIRAAFDGKVRISTFQRRGYGHYVVLRHPNGLETVYGHMSRQLVKRDQVVRAGEPIGLGGSTGRSSGPHLHLEFRFLGIPINPSQIIDLGYGVPLRDVYVFRKGGVNKSSDNDKHASALASIDRSKPARYIGAKNGEEVDLTEDELDTDDKLAKKEKSPSVHRIRKGDTLFAIAKKHGITVDKLCKLNNISKKAVLQVGKTLRVA